MASAEMENIATFLDENSIITYKWLGKQIGIGFQKAKLLLKNYLEQYGMENKVHATYCIVGTERNEDSKNQRVFIVREHDVEKIESRLSQVTSRHVYSIQKSQMKSSNALYMVDLEITRHNYNIEPCAADSIVPSKQKASNDKPSSSPRTIKRSPAEIETVSKQSQKEEKMAENKKEEFASKQNKQNGKAKNFFGNQKPKKSTSTQSSEPKVEKSQPKRTHSSSTNTNGKTFQRIKRPRIESSSSSEESEDEEDPLEPTELNEPVVETEEALPTVEESKAPQFVSKQETVNETFVDEDGYLVTKKKVIMKAEPVKTGNRKDKKTEANTKLQTRPAPKNSKKNAQQSTLTNFFKRS